MPSIDELIQDAYSLKMSSEQLSNMFSAAGQELQRSTGTITELVRGSGKGQEAVTSLVIASRSLLDAASSITTLGRICEDCVAKLSE